MKNFLIILLLTSFFSLSGSARDGVVDAHRSSLRLSEEAIQVLREFANDHEGVDPFNEKHILVLQINTKLGKVDSLFVNFRVELAPYNGDPGRTLYCEGLLIPMETNSKITWILRRQVCRN